MEIVFTTIAGLVLAVLVRSAGPVSGAVMGAATLAAVAAVAWWARVRLGYLLDPTFPALTLSVIYIFCAGFFHFHTTRERIHVRRAFSHYIAPSIVEELARRPEKLRLGGENRIVTLYRSDLAGFSKISEELEPPELVRLMNEYLTAMTNIVMDHDGFIDKYIGDAIDGVFGAPANDPLHAMHAAQSALSCQAQLRKMNAAGLPALQGRKLRQRIGLHTGAGIVGNIGSERRFNYTVMGDVANLASRLEGANKFYGTTILASDATVLAAGPSLVWREIDTIRVVGRSGNVRIYEPIGRADEVTSDQSALIDAYARGLANWRARDFDQAYRCFEFLAAHDPPSRFFSQRCQKLMQNLPPSNWETVHILDSK